jgi:hypothetical protein
VTDERKRLERQRIEEERLANGEATELIPENGEDGDGIRKSTDTRVPTGPMPEIERGLCVVCQDEEATLAVVDCGCVVRVSRWIQLISVLRHLAMCARKFMILTSAKTENGRLFGPDHGDEPRMSVVSDEDCHPVRHPTASHSQADELRRQRLIRIYRV